ncbi:MAG: ribosome-associated translation inhibitor RaiA [bacterium]|nr:ribosome-associated translation inhibitor RaiA [bacterium]
MLINVSARHGDLHPDAQAKIKSKVAKLPRFFDRLTEVEVTVDLKNIEQPKLEIRASAEGHDDFVSTSEGKNIPAALDGAMDKMERQLRKHKEKLTQHRGAGIKHLEPQIDDEEE